jgi:micrococcal nuclease
MQFLPALVIAAVAALDASVPVKRSESLLVRYVIDGDTIDVATVGRVRLLGIDAPEIGRGFDTTAPFARQARDRLAALVLHRWVRLEQEMPRLDVYGRHLAYVVREDGVCVNAVLVAEGLARVSARVGLARLDELKAAEREAQLFRRGMWGQTPTPPAEVYATKRRKVASKTPARYTAKAKKPPTSKPKPREPRRPRAVP